MGRRLAFLSWHVESAFSDNVPWGARVLARPPFSLYPSGKGQMAGIELTPVNVFTRSPMSQFTRSRWFYPVYDGVWFVGLGALWIALEVSGFRGLVPEWEDLSLVHLALFPLVLYGLILCNVFAHNVSHRNFPRPINRLVGEIVGAFVLTRYASWEIIHLRHHKYSDDPEKDPHDCRPGFWLNFLPHFVTNVERQLQQSFYEIHGGRTPENVRFQRARSVFSFLTGVLLIMTFYKVLGAPFFLAVFLPAEILTIIHLAHFNWATHNGASPDGDYHPINIDSGLFWLGNRIFFGIYYHQNHHHTVTAFNPMHLQIAETRLVSEGGALSPIATLSEQRQS